MSNMTIGGSIKAINDLTNMYANNSDLRERLLINLYTGNPFNVDTNLEKRTQNNNTKVLNSYFSTINVNISYDDYKEEELQGIMDLDTDQLESLIDRLNGRDINDIDYKEVNKLIDEIKEV